VSTDPAGSSGSTDGPGSTLGEPSEEELRAAYEAELSRITPADMMLQAAVSLLNLGARRLGLTGPGDRSEAEGIAASAVGAGAGTERDLEQVRDAIDGVRALLGILERSMPQELGPLRDALSQLQIAYARETQQGADADLRTEQAPPAPSKDAPAADGPTADEQPGAPGPAQSSGRLWVPGS
jgi:hypothetical protein